VESAGGGHSKFVTEEQTELWERIQENRSAMLTTVEADGMLRSRPMWTQGDSFDGVLWFFTAYDAPMVDELQFNPHVALSYSAPDKSLFVSVTGRAELVYDRAKIEELWNPFAEAWFPEGPGDPTLSLVRVEVERAQYWEDRKPKVLQLAEIALSLVRDRPPESGDEHKLDFS
jgi:general stress protein 26